MATTHIKSWEFVHEPQVLRYRLTRVSMIPGVLIFSFVALTCIAWALKSFREATGGWGYFWCTVAIFSQALCLYGLFHHLRSYRNPYILNKRTDVFSNGYKPICRLSEISGVEVIRVEGIAGPSGNMRHPYYNVDFALHNGERQGSYVMSTNRAVATQYADVFQNFLSSA